MFNGNKGQYAILLIQIHQAIDFETTKSQIHRKPVKNSLTDSQAEFQKLLELARTGDQSALKTLVGQYEAEVRMVARARLGPALRPHLDSVDLVQSVHKSLFLGLQEGKFDISSPEKLTALAITIVRRKAARVWRHNQRQKRLSGAGEKHARLSQVLVSLSHSGDPTTRVALQEQLDRVLDQIEPESRRLIELRLEGYSTVDAANELGVDADVARVRLSRLRKRLEQAGLAADLV